MKIFMFIKNCSNKISKKIPMKIFMFIKNCLNKISKKYTRASNYYQIHFLLRMV